MSLKNKVIAAAAPLALITLAGCAQSFDARVNRFSLLPPPSQGQTFFIQPSDRKLDGSIEFRSYAQLVGSRLEQLGYRQAASPASANLVVSLDYFVDNGRERVTSTPGFGGFGPYWGGGWGGWGGFRRGWAGYGGLGWGGFGGFGYDPFWGPDVRSYTIYNSQLRMDISRTGNGERVFEGTARATSRTDDLPYLVPNLIDALFTGFPGNSGETVRIRIPQQRTRS